MSFEKLKTLQKDQEKQQYVCVSTHKGKYFGKFDKITCGGKRLHISEVKNIRNEELGKFMCFNEKDVKLVKFVDHCPPLKIDGKEESTNNETLEEEMNSPVRITIQQQDHILMISSNPIYISQADQQYFQALSYISRQFICGLSAVGTNKGRIYNISLLTITTSEKVFIFDMIFLNASKSMKEFKVIFENESIVKVVFESAMLKDNLKIKYDIDVNGFFDLSWAINEFYHSSTPSNDLNRSVKTILNIETPITGLKTFLEHPILQQDLYNVALHSAYLIPMYSVLSQNTFSNYFAKNIEKVKPHPSIEHLMDQLDLNQNVHRKKMNVEAPKTGVFK